MKDTTYTATLPNGETVTFTSKRKQALTHGVAAQFEGRWSLCSKNISRVLAARERDAMRKWNPEYANPQVVAIALATQEASP